MVCEGWDAGGKRGSIKRITEKMDPRGYEVFPIAAPQGEERTHHYLWRFWRRLKSPDEKQVLIFDRSWYDRVMVERLGAFAPKRSGNAHTVRSTSLSANWSILAPSLSSSGST